MCIMYMCERKERGEEKHKIDKRQNEVLKKKKEMYINKENKRYKIVALQGVTTDLILSKRKVFYIRSPSLFIYSLQQPLSH